MGKGRARTVVKEKWFREWREGVPRGPGMAEPSNWQIHNSGTVVGVG